MSTIFEQTAIDAVRDYWNARPCNIRHSLKPIGERDYYLEVRQRKHFIEPHIPGFAEFAKWKGKRVLEVGCGLGTASFCFAEAGAEMTSVDLSSKSLEIAEQGARALGLGDRITFAVADAEHIAETLPHAHYDLIYSFGVIHHTPHPDAALAQIRKLVKLGGTLKVMVYHRYSWKVLWLIMTEGKGRFWRADEIIARNSEAQTGCPVTYSYSRSSAREWVERHGFKVEDIYVDHVFPYRIPDYVQYRYVKTWYFRILPKPLFRAFERIFGWHLMVTAKAV